MNKNLPELREKALSLPLLPGVYIMLDSNNEIIYIGKAKKLKNRVSSYFHGDHLPKVAAMIDKIEDFHVIIAASEFEALILENSLIKRHKPHYNILLKDDKGYPFIMLNMKEEYPRFSLSNKGERSDCKYFGPFGARSASRDIIAALNKIYLLPDCSRKFPRDIGKDRPCLNYQMGICQGWCQANQSSEDYRNRISDAAMILSGKSEELIKDMTCKMNEAAESLQFEYAAEIRDRIKAIDTLSRHQRVIATSFADTDAVGFYRGPKSCFSILHFRAGNLVAKDAEFIAEPLEDDGEAVTSFLCRYYSSAVNVPHTILTPLEIEEKDDIERLILEINHKKVSIEAPKRGEKNRLIESAVLNAKEEVLRSTSDEERRLQSLNTLQKMLHLNSYPKRIEAFDISNLRNTGIVAAMTVHIDGKPAKKEYRKFRMKNMPVQNDYESMYQTIYRRFKRYIDGDDKFSKLPDLLLIDGGAVHAGIAEKALQDLQLKLPVYGMVKDDRHRTRALITSAGCEIGISQNPSVFALIGNIQEETHKSAITYQRSLRNKSLSSCLDGIEGIGPVRHRQLIKRYKTIQAISAAEICELKQLVPDKVANNIYTYFHTEESLNAGN